MSTLESPLHNRYIVNSLLCPGARRGVTRRRQRACDRLARQCEASASGDRTKRSSYAARTLLQRQVMRRALQPSWKIFARTPLDQMAIEREKRLLDHILRILQRLRQTKRHNKAGGDPVDRRAPAPLPVSPFPCPDGACASSVAPPQPSRRGEERRGMVVTSVWRNVRLHLT